MTTWVENDPLSPSNLNARGGSATTVGGFSTNTLSAETGSTVSALGNLLSASTFSAGAAFVAATGSAVAPAFRLASEQSLGLYRSAASELAVSYGTFVPSDLSATGQGAFSNLSSAGSLLALEVWASGVSVGSGSTLQNVNMSALTATSLTVSGTGPHAIGGATSGRRQIFVSGTFTSDAGGTNAAGLFLGQALAGAGGDTSYLAILNVEGAVATQTAAESIAVISQLRVIEPQITDNLTGGGVITNADTVFIVGAPTEGVTNNALRIGAGNTLLQALEIDGDLNHDGTNVGFYGTAPVAQQTSVAVTTAAIHAALVNLGLITA